MSPELLTALGIAFSIFFSFYGTCVASAVAGTYLFASPCAQIWKATIPIVIAGVLAIYGLIVAIILAFQMKTVSGDMVAGYKNLAAGLSVGLACMWSGMAMANFLADSLYSNATQEENASEAALLSDHRLQVPLLSSSFFRTRRVTDISVPEVTTRFFMALVFLEAIGLYGLIIALVLVY